MLQTESKRSDYVRCHACGNAIFRPNPDFDIYRCEVCNGGQAIRMSIWDVVLQLSSDEVKRWRDATGNMTPEECAEDIREAALLEQEAEQRYTRLEAEYLKHLDKCCGRDAGITPSCKHLRYVEGQEYEG